MNQNDSAIRLLMAAFSPRIILFLTRIRHLQTDTSMRAAAQHRMLILQAFVFLEHYQFKVVKLEWFCELLWIKQRFGNLIHFKC